VCSHEGHLRGGQPCVRWQDGGESTATGLQKGKLAEKRKKETYYKQRAGVSWQKEHSDVVHAAARGTATWRVQLQGHGKVGHVSVVMSFRPRCTSSPSWSVVGPGGPQGRGWPCHAVTGLLQKEEVSKKKKEKEKDKTYQKENSPVAVLGVGVINEWRETYLTPTG